MRLVIGTRTRLVELARRPTALVLLVVLPPLVIEMYGVALESFPALPTVADDPAAAGRRTGTLFAVAFLAGLVGLFQVISARRGDERLVLCGFPRSALLVARLVALAVVVVVAALVAGATLWWRIDVAAPGAALAVLVLGGALYGLLGVVVGTVLPRDLEGSLVVVMIADLDNALSSDLFDVGAAARLAPLHHPHDLFEAAVLGQETPIDALWWSAAWVVALLAVAFVAYGRAVGAGGPRR